MVVGASEVVGVSEVVGATVACVSVGEVLAVVGVSVAVVGVALVVGAGVSEVVAAGAVVVAAGAWVVVPVDPPGREIIARRPSSLALKACPSPWAASMRPSVAKTMARSNKRLRVGRARRAIEGGERKKRGELRVQRALLRTCDTLWALDGCSPSSLSSRMGTLRRMRRTNVNQALARAVLL